ncbi:hypothetical protein M2352_001558 [Azospirillum fermentarium]|uniref:hypothetical protein n=1 Tax=Azospirillum fermentarium TaxID=1233114 RepID=UPI0022275515|nr:hypothetical protein [Azospirillum fermentarium]MCW2245967.1 hypothetical protein [Azospirillum fermentarium]
MMSTDLRLSSLRHVELLDSFIRTAEDALSLQADPFMRDSLGDLLGTLRAERDSYARMAGGDGRAGTA